MSDLRDYISKVKKIKELKTIKTQVSTKYEIAGVTAKVDQSHAVLFENIKESAVLLTFSRLVCLAYMFHKNK